MFHSSRRIIRILPCVVKLGSSDRQRNAEWFELKKSAYLQSRKTHIWRCMCMEAPIDVLSWLSSCSKGTSCLPDLAPRWACLGQHWTPRLSQPFCFLPFWRFYRVFQSSIHPECGCAYVFGGELTHLCTSSSLCGRYCLLLSFFILPLYWIFTVMQTANKRSN